jgi:geranylgeranyl diphosphate synthase type II
VSTLSFTEYAAVRSSEINAALERYTEFNADCPDRLRAAIRHSLLAPGKRLRPMLVLMAAEACGCDRQRAMPAACAVEMIHTYSLIHDDLPAMDDDDMRRGRPTCHVAFDEATAILAGDALLARSFEVLARDIEPPATAARCCAELAQAAGATALVGGQVDDLSAEFSAGNIEELERIHRRKTGAMFLVSLRLGGIVGDAASSQMAALNQYGRNLGLAFQIVDDLLDVHGESNAMGKRVAKDAGHGKLTFPALLGVESSRVRAEQLIREAEEAVQVFGEHGGPLQGLAQFVLERNR